MNFNLDLRFAIEIAALLISITAFIQSMRGRLDRITDQVAQVQKTVTHLDVRQDDQDTRLIRLEERFGMKPLPRRYKALEENGA